MMQNYLFMTIKPELSCLALDLDDTLYKEYDYQTSGLVYIEKEVLNLYKIDLKGRLLELRDAGVDDIFFELTKILKLPPSIKDSFQMMYRYHRPDIQLTPETKDFLKLVLYDFKQVVILTDGRSLTQRLKLEALNLMDIPVYISEEWDSNKPDKKRFIAIMEKYSFCENFYYVADNPLKDFLAPNELKWISLCLRGDSNNIHSQNTNGIRKKYLPDHWIDNLNNIYKF
jgi:putative hydrolase of the HAD superfamily